MKYFLYIILVFWGIWILWYLGGGPLKEDRLKPFVVPSSDNTFEYKDSVDTGLEKYTK